MTFRIIQLVLLTTVTMSTYGQDNSNLCAFYRTEEICQVGHYTASVKTQLTTVVQFSGNDSVKFAYYSTNSSDKYQSITREVFTGVFRKSGDTAVIQFISETYEKKNRFGVVETKAENLPTDNDFRNCMFIVRGDLFIPANDHWTGVLEASSMDRIHEIELRYNSWSSRLLIDR